MSRDSTKKELLGTWLIPNPESNGGNTRDSKFKDYRFMYRIEEISEIGDIYTFMEDGALEYVKTKIVNTDYQKGPEGSIITRYFDRVKESIGIWDLMNYHQIQIALEGVTESFEVEYLSRNELRLRKL
jgi:hypothetical protein